MTPNPPGPISPFLSDRQSIPNLADISVRQSPYFLYIPFRIPIFAFDNLQSLYHCFISNISSEVLGLYFELNMLRIPSLNVPSPLYASLGDPSCATAARILL